MRGDTLHITNGDSALYLFRKAGIVGEHVAWRDGLHEGPVARGPLQRVSMVRADYLSQRGYGNPIALHRSFEVRDKILNRASQFAGVVLWFEHDLYDQLQLLQILVALADLELEPGHVCLIQSDHYLSSLDANEFGALFPKRRTVTEGMFSAARTAWDAFTSDDPSATSRVAGEDRMGLPFVRSAFARLCEEYPGHDGLSRTQRQALEAVRRGVARGDDIFRRSQAQEEAPFIGDASFFANLADMTQAPAPLLQSRSESFHSTALGKSVLDGGVDWIASQPIDRYIGGVRLCGNTVPRFHTATRTFVKA